MTENDIQSSILEYLTLKKIGSFERVNNVPVYDEKLKCYRRPSKYSKKGVCDIIGCVNGRFIGIEVKTVSEFKVVTSLWNKTINRLDIYCPINKKEAHFLNQIKYITEKNKNGGYCFFTYSLEHTIEKIETLLRSQK